MPFNYSKLKGKIKEVFGTEKAFAEAMGWAGSTKSAKLNNNSVWDQADILKACRLLGLSESDIPDYFFAKEVR